MAEKDYKVTPLQVLFGDPGMSDRDALVLFLKQFPDTKPHAERRADAYYAAMEKQLERLEKEFSGTRFPMPTWATMWTERGSPAALVTDQQGQKHLVVDPFLLLEKPAHLTPQELAAVVEHEWGHVVPTPGKTQLQRECSADHMVKYMSDPQNPLDKNLIRALQKLNAFLPDTGEEHLLTKERIAFIRNKTHSDIPPQDLRFEDDCRVEPPLVPLPQRKPEPRQK